MFHSLSSETWRWQYTSTSVCIHILPVTSTERIFFFNDVTLFTFLSLFKRKIILPLWWIKAPNVMGMRRFSHVQIYISVAGSWLEGQNGKALGSFCSRFCWENKLCRVCVCDSAGILSLTTDLVLIKLLGWNQSRISALTAQTAPGSQECCQFVLVSAAWSIWEIQNDLFLLRTEIQEHSHGSLL